LKRKQTSPQSSEGLSYQGLLSRAIKAATLAARSFLELSNPVLAGKNGFSAG